MVLYLEFFLFCQVRPYGRVMAKKLKNITFWTPIGYFLPPFAISAIFDQNDTKKKLYMVNHILATTFRKDFFFLDAVYGGSQPQTLLPIGLRPPRNITVQKSLFYKSCSLGSFQYTYPAPFDLNQSGGADRKPCCQQG